jgi:hypothetical protein
MTSTSRRWASATLLGISRRGPFLAQREAISSSTSLGTLFAAKMNRAITLETSDQGPSRIGTWADQLAPGFVFKRRSYVGRAPEVEDAGLPASHRECRVDPGSCTPSPSQIRT